MYKVLLILTFTLYITSCGTEFNENFCPTLSDCSGSTDGVFNTYFSDDFNRADGLIDSATWTTVNAGGSSVNILSNQIQPLSNAVLQPVAMHNVLVTASSFRMTIEFSINGTDFSGNIATGNIGIFALSQSPSNFTNAYFCGIQGGINGDSLYVLSTVGGAPVASTVDAGSVPLNNGDSYALTLIVSDGLLTCSISGSYNATVTLNDSNYSSGYSGFGGGNTAVAADGELLFDNFLLEIIN